MAVHKRVPGLDADYYVTEATVRRSVRTQEPETRRYSDDRPQRSQPRSRHAEPVRDQRSLQDRRRAEPSRAYYDPEPSTQRLTHEEVNRRARREHMRLRAQAEQQAAQEQARLLREAQEEEARRKQHSVVTAFALLAIVGVMALAGGVFLLLQRYDNINKMILEQRSITAEIEVEQKKLEELQVEINRQGNIATIQDYARSNLNMDYAAAEDVRRIELPQE